MVKTLGLMALATVAALVLGVGSQAGSAAPKAHADTTGVAVVGCELVAIQINTAAAFDDACGSQKTPATVPPTFNTLTPADITALANKIGNEDGKLTLSDFSGEFNQNLSGNQISTDCTQPPGPGSTIGTGTTIGDTLVGLACTLDVFVFVNDKSPVTLDLPTGLKSIEGQALAVPTLDFTCNTDGTTLGLDNDCSGTTPNTGDGVVVFHILEDTAAAGDVKTVTVSQGAVDQSFDVNVVGSPNDVKLTLVEKTIETNGNSTNVAACQGGTSVTDAITAPTSTLAYAQAFDQNDTVLTRVPVFFSITPPEDAEIAVLGQGNETEEITGNTFFTIHPKTTGAPTAAYVVVCGGKNTGTATVDASINISRKAPFSSMDHSGAALTVTGAPSAVALTATAATIKCDGSETSTVTANVTDSAGNKVADGVPVNFSVVALGTANPINTTTKDGMATTQVTPLSNSSAGVTVIVTAGDSSIASLIQTSVRVDCALPLATQPTLAPPPPAVPTARIGVTGPDTGNGGYLGQNGSSAFPMWTLVLLAVGSLTLVAGGAVARRAGK